MVAVGYGGVCETDLHPHRGQLGRGVERDAGTTIAKVPGAIDPLAALSLAHLVTTYPLEDHGAALRDVAEGAVMKAVLTAL